MVADAWLPWTGGGRRRAGDRYTPKILVRSDSTSHRPDHIEEEFFTPTELQAYILTKSPSANSTASGGAQRHEALEVLGLSGAADLLIHVAVRAARDLY